MAPRAGSRVLSARNAVLAQIRGALGERAEAAPRRHAAKLEPRPGSADLFASRVAEYRATVTRVSDGDALSAAVTAACERNRAQSLLIPHGLPDEWLPDRIEVVREPIGSPLPLGDLIRLDGVITGCAIAIAETGTLVLDGGVGQGRRAVTLVPDLHVCVVSVDRIVADVADAIAAVEPRAGVAAPVTFVSGPSATSDIELSRVEGVHGPRRLEVIVVAEL